MNGALSDSQDPSSGLGGFRGLGCRALSGPEAWLGSRVVRRAAELKSAEREESGVNLTDSFKTERLRGLDSCAS